MSGSGRIYGCGSRAHCTTQPVDTTVAPARACGYSERRGGASMLRGLGVRAVVLVALAGVLWLPTTVAAQKRGGTLVMLVQPEPPTLASYVSTSGPIGQVATKVY